MVGWIAQLEHYYGELQNFLKGGARQEGWGSCPLCLEVPLHSHNQAESLWVKTKDQTNKAHLVAGVWCRLSDQREPVDEAFLLQLQEVLLSQALIQMEDVNHPGVCWENNMASCSQARRVLQSTEDKFPVQVLDRAKRGEAVQDLMLLSGEDLIKETGRSLCGLTCTVNRSGAHCKRRMWSCWKESKGGPQSYEERLRKLHLFLPERRGRSAWLDFQKAILHLRSHSEVCLGPCHFYPSLNRNTESEVSAWFFYIYHHRQCWWLGFIWQRQAGLWNYWAPESTICRKVSKLCSCSLEVKTLLLLWKVQDIKNTAVPVGVMKHLRGLSVWLDT